MARGEGIIDETFQQSPPAATVHRGPTIRDALSQLPLAGRARGRGQQTITYLLHHTGQPQAPLTGLGSTLRYAPSTSRGAPSQTIDLAPSEDPEEELLIVTRLSKRKKNPEDAGGTGSSAERDHARTEESVKERRPSHVDREDTTRGGRSGGGRSSCGEAGGSGHEAGSEEVAARGEREEVAVISGGAEICGRGARSSGGGAPVVSAEEK
ncbi:hypothetical protein Scep_002587 [Stephania cephalantha]|uniref:Uncharacterized protein n=1 Tax=Stephania cephalantha TaxID=152367 RepID=A0AAP0Q8X5_9MAGN